MSSSVARPGAGGLWPAFRAAAVDFYFHSVALVGANAVLGALALVVVWVALSGAAIAWAAMPLLVVPWLVLQRVACAAVRDEVSDTRDAILTARRRAIAGVVVASALLLGTIALVMNVETGVATGGIAGWSLAVLAGWGLLAGWTWAFAFWPVLTDPARDDVSAVVAARQAASIVVGEPGRLLAAAVVAALVVAVSTVLFVALLIVGPAFVALFAARVVLPRADAWAQAGVSASASASTAARSQSSR